MRIFQHISIHQSIIAQSEYPNKKILIKMISPLNREKLLIKKTLKQKIYMRLNKMFKRRKVLKLN